ncbi:MAG: DUF4157 domain-containing protein [Dehalococcoidales bacterium]|nr:DUF4157 domain-containing protein [Dehalococcoidales bacterium]
MAEATRRIERSDEGGQRVRRNDDAGVSQVGSDEVAQTEASVPDALPLLGRRGALSGLVGGAGGSAQQADLLLGLQATAGNAAVARLLAARTTVQAEGESEEAQGNVEEGLPEEPVARASALFRRGAEGYEAGDYGRAAECFLASLQQPGIAQDPRSGIAWRNLGEARRHQGNTAGALEAFRMALGYSGLDPERRRLVEEAIAELEGGSGEPGTGEEVVEASTTRAPSGSEMTEAPATTPAEEQLPDDVEARRRALFERGVQAFNAGDFFRAEDWFEALLEVPGTTDVPQAGVFWRNLGVCRFQQSDSEGAAAAYRRALGYPELPPDQRAQIERALTEIEGDGATGGEATGQQSAPGEEAGPPATETSGPEAAVDTSSKGSVDVKGGVGGTAREVGVATTGPPRGEAIERPPSDPEQAEAWEREQDDRAASLYRAGNYEGAARVLENLLRQAPRGAEPERRGPRLYNLGTCYWRMGNLAAARARYEQFLDIPGMPEERRTRVEERLREMESGTAQGSLQRQEYPEEEEEIQTQLAARALQRQETPEEEEEIQAKVARLSLQRQEEEEDELVQAKGELLRQEEEEEEVQTAAANRKGRLGAGPGTKGSTPSTAGVRIHADAEADSLAREYNAVAFTSGSDIYFREGAYQPETAEGRQLLGHELAHIAQQAEGRTAGLEGLEGDPSLRESLEAEADEAGAAAAGGPARPRSPGREDDDETGQATAGVLQRASAEVPVVVHAGDGTVQRNPDLRLGRASQTLRVPWGTYEQFDGSVQRLAVREMDVPPEWLLTLRGLADWNLRQVYDELDARDPRRPDGRIVRIIAEFNATGSAGQSYLRFAAHSRGMDIDIGGEATVEAGEAPAEERSGGEARREGVAPVAPGVASDIGAAGSAGGPSGSRVVEAASSADLVRAGLESIGAVAEAAEVGGAAMPTVSAGISGVGCITFIILGLYATGRANQYGERVAYCRGYTLAVVDLSEGHNPNERRLFSMGPDTQRWESTGRADAIRYLRSLSFADAREILLMLRDTFPEPQARVEALWQEQIEEMSSDEQARAPLPPQY